MSINMVSSGGSLWFGDWRSETRQYPNTAPPPTTVRLRLRWLVGADVPSTLAPHGSLPFLAESLDSPSASPIHPQTHYSLFVIRN